MLPGETYPFSSSGDEPGGDGVGREGPVISYGSGLGVGWHSHWIGEVALRPVGLKGCFTFAVYANSRVPAYLPTWPRELSLRPDLSGPRRH